MGLSAWTKIGWVEIDSATAGFGDGACRSVLGDSVLELYLGLTDPDARVIDFTRYGVPLIAFSTMADGTYPVELARDRAGWLLAARICFDDRRGRIGGSLATGRGHPDHLSDLYCGGPLHRSADVPMLVSVPKWPVSG
jgi:hypothetical protein